MDLFFITLVIIAVILALLFIIINNSIPLIGRVAVVLICLTGWLFECHLMNRGYDRFERSEIIAEVMLCIGIVGYIGHEIFWQVKKYRYKEEKDDTNNTQ